MKIKHKWGITRWLLRQRWYLRLTEYDFRCAFGFHDWHPTTSEYWKQSGNDYICPRCWETRKRFTDL